MQFIVLTAFQMKAVVGPPQSLISLPLRPAKREREGETSTVQSDGHLLEPEEDNSYTILAMRPVKRQAL